VSKRGINSEWGCSFRGRELQGFVLEVEGADEVGEHRGDGDLRGLESGELWILEGLEREENLREFVTD